MCDLSEELCKRQSGVRTRQGGIVLDREHESDEVSYTCDKGNAKSYCDREGRVPGWVWHFFRQMSDPIKAAERIKGIDKTSDEADDLVLPSGIVDPCPENKL